MERVVPPCLPAQGRKNIYTPPGYNSLNFSVVVKILEV